MTGKRQIAEPIEQEVFADLMSPNRVVLAKERRKKLTNKNDLNKKLPMPSEVRRRREEEADKENNPGTSSLVPNPLAKNSASNSTTSKLKALKAETRDAVAPSSTKQRGGSVMSLRSKVSSAR